MNIKTLLLITNAIFISACSPYIVSANPNHSASKSDEKAEKI
nr:truncated OXA family beta-lactamase [Acinetobacter baumannii]